jgi:hypothetical protein
MTSKTFPLVQITDETLRDGLQIERHGVTVEEKLELLDSLADAGLRRIVVGAFVNAKWSPQMAETTELVRRIRPREGVQFFALALNDRGRELRAAFVPPLAVEPLPATHLHLCETFLRRNTNRSLEDQERSWRRPVEVAAAAGVTEGIMGLSAAWGSNWYGPFSHEQRMEALQRQWDAWHAAGIPVRRINGLVWGLSAAVAAIAGLLLAPVTFVHANMGFIGLKAFPAAVVGGFGSLPGAIVGGLVIGLVEAFAGFYLPEGFKDIAAYVVVLVMLVVKPNGLFGGAMRKKV